MLLSTPSDQRYVLRQFPVLAWPCSKGWQQKASSREVTRGKVEKGNLHLPFVSLNLSKAEEQKAAKGENQMSLAFRIC